jgi:hypothetical protein
MWRPGAARIIRPMLPARHVLLAALACVTTASLPATTAAKVPHHVVYDVDTAALGTLKVHQHEDDGTNTYDEVFNLDFSYDASYQDVVFIDGDYAYIGDTPIQDAGLQLHEGEIRQTWPGGGSAWTCPPGAAQLIIGGQGIIHNDDSHTTANATGVVWRPAESLFAELWCGPAGHEAQEGTTFDLIKAGGTGTAPIGQGPIDMFWQIPHEALGADHLEHNVEQEPWQTAITACPAFSNEQRTAQCELRWSGKVVMDRVREGGGTPDPGDDGDDAGDVVIDVPPPPAPVPAPPAPPGPASPPAPIPAPPSSTPTPPKVGPARLSRDRRRVTFTVTCPAAAPCSGKATAKGAKPLRFTIRAGARRTVALSLAKAAKRGAKVSLSVAVTTPGATTRATLKA